MNPQSAKKIIAVPIIVAGFSLAMNLILLLRLRQSNEEAEKWKMAHERIAREQLDLKKQLENQLLLRSQKGETLNPVPSISQQDNSPSPPKRSLQSPTELPTRPEEISDPSRDVYREQLRNMLTAALEEDFPELDLNEAELQELTDSVITIRESMEDLRHIERSSDNVEAIKALRERRDQAMLDFEKISGVNAMEFMRRAPAEGGIDRE